MSSLFEKFTDRARRTIVLSQEEARLLGHNYIGTEHLLLGLIAEDQGVAGRVLTEFGLTLDQARDDVESMTGRVSSAPTGHIPFTPRSKKVLELSLRESLKLNHHYVGTEHLLLGLIGEGEGVAAQILMKRGIEFGRVRDRVVEFLGKQGGNVAVEASSTWATSVGGLSDGARKVLSLASEGSRDGETKASHLLAALLRLAAMPAEEVDDAIADEIAELRRAIERLKGESEPEAG